MARKIAVEIVGDASSLEKAFKKSERSAGKFNQQMGRAGKKGPSLFGGVTKAAGLLTAGLGVAGLAGAAKAAFTEMADAQKVTAQTAAVLESTGGAANVTAGHVDTLANSLLNVSGVDDEVIKSGENMLLTFTNIRNEVGKNNDIFDQATRTALDMSTALGTDMKQSALQLGKALQDPIKGVGALRRVGVAFTDQQKDQIKQLVETGHTMEAQKLILRELNKEFGGSARAAGDTLSGKLNKLRNTALNLGAQLAETLLPTITKVVDVATKWLSNSKNQQTVLDAVKTAAGLLAKTLKTLGAIFHALSVVVGGNRHAIIVLTAAFVALRIAMIATTLAASGVSLAFMGPLGIAVAVGAASFALSVLIRKIPGWNKALTFFGGTIENLAEKLGLLRGAGKTGFEGISGKQAQTSMRVMRREAAKLEARGRTPTQAADVLQRRHPGFTRHDVEVAAGVGVGGVNINIQHFHSSAPNARQLENELVKRSKQRPHPRRGP